ncbi:MAG: hypothetical protein HWE22_09775 [Flavobacteriales bacterium]|nr:hypothetical protein [Flavobacteriales bacterium]
MRHIKLKNASGNSEAFFIHRVSYTASISSPVGDKYTVTLLNVTSGRTMGFRYNNGWVGFSDIITLPAQAGLEEGFVGLGMERSDASVTSGFVVGVGSLMAGKFKLNGGSSKFSFASSGVGNIKKPSFGSVYQMGSKRVSNETMAGLSNRFGIEFSQVYTMGPGKNGGGGTYSLYAGSVNRVKVPIAPNKMWINHTHPGGTMFPSAADKSVLRMLQNSGSPQRSSSIVGGGTGTGLSIRFSL